LPVFKINHVKARQVHCGERTRPFKRKAFPVVAEMTVDDIAELMATLSQCQHALVLSHAGMEVSLPVDPTIAFEPVAGGYALGVFEAHWQHALGSDTELGAVELQLLSRKGRLTNIALPPDAARHLGVTP
jgi:hypothetical protein